MEAIYGDHRNIEREENRAVSFALAVLVHAILALLLLVSVQWRTQRLQAVEVELWGAPPPEAVVAAMPAPEVTAPPVISPVPEVKPDIVEEKIKPAVKPVEKPVPQPEPAIKVAKPQKEARPSLADILKQGTEQRNQARVTTSAAVSKPLARASGTGTNPLALTTTAGNGDGAEAKPGKEYSGLVVRIIKSNLVYPENRKESPKVKIKVSLLPDGSIRDAQVVRVVGDPAYAEAAKRAVMTTQRFPPQPDGKPFSGEWREWILSFCAKENAECRID